MSDSSRDSRSGFIYSPTYLNETFERDKHCSSIHVRSLTNVLPCGSMAPCHAAPLGAPRALVAASLRASRLAFFA